MYVSGRLSVMRHLLGNEAVARGGQVGTGKDSPPHMVYLNFPTSASKSAVRGFHAHLSPAASFWGRRTKSLVFYLSFPFTNEERKEET